MSKLKIVEKYTISSIFNIIDKQKLLSKFNNSNKKN